MDRLQRAAIITRLVEALLGRGSWAGETHIQKAAYLLQEMLGVPLGYEFVIYRYGPFSFDLRDELVELRGEKLVQLIPQSRPYGPRYSVVHQKAEYIQKLYPSTLTKYDDKIQFIANKLGNSGVATLERKATAYYVKRKLGDHPIEALKKELVTLKPHISAEEASIAFREVEMIEEEAKSASLIG